MRRLLGWLVFMAAAAAGAWVIYSRTAPDTTEARRQFGQPVPVLATEATETDVPVFLDALGRVQAFNSVTVRAMIDGPLIEVDSAEGQNVAWGAVLARIDPRPYQATLDQAIAIQAIPLTSPTPLVDGGPHPALFWGALQHSFGKAAFSMSGLDLDGIVSELTGENIFSEGMLAKLRQFSLTERETISRRTGTVTVYFDGEVTQVRAAEEAGALRAMPAGFDILDLNGLNIGCGNRSIHDSLIPVDIARRSLVQEGGHASASANALLALTHDLPFRANSIDFIVALHVLEHIDDPVSVLRHWVDVLKPGGGIGLVVPDWRYTWDARHDESAYGHKWNAEPDLVRRLWEEHLSDICGLEAMQTYPYKLSFDVVLRKPGLFQPFTLPTGVHAESGAARSRRGVFLGL